MDITTPIPSYSLASFRNKMVMTENYWILVEGKDDKHAIAQLARRLNGVLIDAGRLNIDTSSIVHDEVLSGLGAKSKLEAIAEFLVSSLGNSNNMRILTDRETEDFDIETGCDLKLEAPANPLIVRTRGHSIENYVFWPDYFCEYIQDHSADEGVKRFIQVLRNGFTDLLRTSASLSRLAYSLDSIERLKSTLSDSHFTISSDSIMFSPEAWINSLVNTYGKDESNRIVDIFNQSIALMQIARMMT